MPFLPTFVGAQHWLIGHRLGAVLLMLVASLMLGLGAPHVHAVEGPPPAPAVLIVSGSQHGLPVPEAMINGAAAALKAQGIPTSNIYVEHLDLGRFDQPDAAAILAGMMRRKYADKHIEVVITQNQPALEFLAHAGYDLLPAHQPLVATLVATPDITWRGSPRQILNVSNQYDVAGTVHHGLELFPRTRRLVLVAGVGRTQATLPAQLTQALATHRRLVEIEDTSSLPYEAMLQRVSELPPDSLVILADYFQDRTGRPFVPAEVVAAVAKRQCPHARVVRHPHPSRPDGRVCGGVLRSWPTCRGSGGQPAAR